MSVELLDIVLLVQDRRHVGFRLGVLRLTPHTASVVPKVPLASQIEGEVDDSLLTVQIFLLKFNIN